MFFLRKHMHAEWKIGTAAVLAVAVCIVCVFFLTGKDATTTMQQQDCGVLSKDKQVQCFVDEVVTLAQTIGITKAVDRVSDLLVSYPDIQNDCHAIMHAIGDESYKLYREGAVIEITPSITMCTYGFYHGFINAVVTHEGSFEPAAEFCAYVNTELLKQGIVSSEAECYHGFGHAVVDDHVSTQFSNAHDVTVNALRLCDDLSSTVDLYRNCASGVYNAVANIFVGEDFPWPEIENSDTVDFCGQQPQLLRDTCYGYFARVILTVHNGNLSEALAFASNMIDPKYKKGTIENIAVIFMLGQQEKEDIRAPLQVCNSLAGAHRDACTAGLSVGILQSADAHTAMAVCADDAVPEDARPYCYDRFLLNLQALVSKSELQDVCAMVAEGYHTQVCTG